MPHGTVFDLDTKMRVYKIVNLSELSIKTGVPYQKLVQMQENNLIHIATNHIESLCKFFNCTLTQLTTPYSAERVKNLRRWREEMTFFKPQGVVYFLKAESGEFEGLTKIGFTKDLLTRVNGLRYEHKTNIEIVHYHATNDAPNLEAVMHNVFKAKRITGEWFDLSEEDIALIKA